MSNCDNLNKDNAQKFIEKCLPFFAMLNEMQIDYCLVGGLAVTVHSLLSGGDEIRATRDIDILVANDTDVKKLIERYVKTYQEGSDKVRLSKTMEEFNKLDASLDFDGNVNIPASEFFGIETEAPDVDVCRKLNALTLDDMSPSLVTINNVAFPLASLDDLIQMKSRTVKMYGAVNITESSRPQDYIDLKTLTNLALAENKTSERNKESKRNPLKMIKQIFKQEKPRENDRKNNRVR